ncbi:MAG: cysteine synthase family protein [Deltaproteobacteria bacterium]|nr:cysteine synthase family protein [Deltaproteobacteria bacterium]
MKLSNIEVEDVVKGTILEMVGNTPLYKLRGFFQKKTNSTIYAKLEKYNPGGSVKDRPALRMILEGIKSGHLTKSKVILESTSGNTGIALAMIGAVLGYRVKIYMPKNVSDERKKTLNAFGAEVVLTDPVESSDGAYRECILEYERNSEKYFKPDQYNNPANPLSHYETTAPEIIKQTDGKITHFIAGIGTGGTLVGTGKRLKEYDPSIEIIGVEPDSPFHGLEGLKHIESSIVPGILDKTSYDRVIHVKTEDAYNLVREVARKEGILVGESSGAALWACLTVAREIKDAHIVTVFPDGGSNYFSTRLWE